MNDTDSNVDVGHWQEDDCDVYAGRGYDGEAMMDVEIGERGWLGNPFTVEEHGRATCIEMYRMLFEKRLAAGSDFRRAIAELGEDGATLGCWCQRLEADEPACHAEVIVRWATELAEE